MPANDVAIFSGFMPVAAGAEGVSQNYAFTYNHYVQCRLISLPVLEYDVQRGCERD